MIDCSIEIGGKSSPLALASYRFIEQGPSIWRYLACDATESDDDLMNRLDGFDPGGAAAVAHIGDTPVYALPPSDPLFAAQTHQVMLPLHGSDRTKAEQTLEGLKLPILVFQDPWNRWLRMVHSSLRTPDMCEPIIYLYADPPLKVSVRFGDGLTVYRTWPPTEQGWTAIAQPDGRSVVDAQLWDHLFWDGTSLEFPRPDRGWVVPRATLNASLHQLLPTLGLQGREVDEAIAAWKPNGDGEWVRIGVHERARVDRIAPLFIEPAPDTSIRVFVELEAVDAFEALPPPDLKPPHREGFVFVEWGLVARSP